LSTFVRYLVRRTFVDEILFKSIVVKSTKRSFVRVVVENSLRVRRFIAPTVCRRRTAKSKTSAPGSFFEICPCVQPYLLLYILNRDASTGGTRSFTDFKNGASRRRFRIVRKMYERETCSRRHGDRRNSWRSGFIGTLLDVAIPFRTQFADGPPIALTELIPYTIIRNARRSCVRRNYSTRGAGVHSAKSITRSMIDQ